jgi:hypothetical protein
MRPKDQNSDSKRKDASRNKTEEDLKWIEENIPSSIADTWVVHYPLLQLDHNCPIASRFCELDNKVVSSCSSQRLWFMLIFHFLAGPFPVFLILTKKSWRLNLKCQKWSELIIRACCVWCVQKLFLWENAISKLISPKCIYELGGIYISCTYICGYFLLLYFYIVYVFHIRT